MASLTKDVYVIVEVDVKPDSPELVKSLKAFLQDYFNKHLEHDFKGFSVSMDKEAEVDGDPDSQIMICFDGECKYDYYPGTPRTFDDPGDPEEMEQSVYLDDFVPYVETAVESYQIKNPKAPDGSSYDVDVSLLEADFEEDIDAIAGEIFDVEPPEYDPDYYNEAVDAILSGVPIREAIVNKKTK